MPDRLQRGAARISPAALANGIAMMLEFAVTDHDVDRIARERIQARVERVRATMTRDMAFESAIAILRERLDVKVQGNKAKVINSSDQALKAAEGQFQPHPRQPGVFAVTFQTPRGAMTQIWIFRPDGSAAIRENPDRGEQQSAVPVTGDSIEVPAAKQ